MFKGSKIMEINKIDMDHLANIAKQLKQKVEAGEIDDLMALHQLRSQLPNYSLQLAKKLWFSS
jgi:hypothetical protein